MSENIIDKIAKLSIRLRISKARLGKNSEDSELNERQIVCLEILSLMGSMKITDLCKNLNDVGQSTTSMDVKLFRRKGWVNKRFSEEDERVRFIELTEDGRELVNEIQKRRLRTFLPLVKAIGSDIEEIKIIEKVVDRANSELDFVLNINLENLDSISE